jgi:HlyD family secretion protein
MRKNSLTSIFFGITIIAILGLSLSACSAKASAGGSKGYRFGAVTKGSIEKTVSSSGNLEPESEVNVLSEMSGRVEKVNADYNDKVVQGQVLVQINTDMLKLSELEQEANVKKGKSSYDLALLDYQNKQKLSASGLISDYDLKSAQTNLDVLDAELVAAQAQLTTIQTKIKDYAYIKSPISGIVLERDVDVGQSVVEGSSSNSSSLFTLAKDLINMEIKTKVDELDIAAIKKGMGVRFTVEALPSETFSGTVKEIRLVPETTNNVVNYYVMVRADNSSGKLMPGMTAEVTFIQSVVKDALLVPNASLRYTPSSLSAAQIKKQTFVAGLSSNMSESDKSKAVADFDKQLAEAEKAGTKTNAGGLTGMMMGGGPRPGGGPGGPGAPGGARKSSATSGTAAAPSASGAAAGEAAVDPSSLKTIWCLNDKGELEVHLVQVGVSDGSKTVVSCKDDISGLKVILQEEVK